MNRRELLKALGITSIAVFSGQLGENIETFGKDNKIKLKNWAWITTDINTPIDDWKRNFAVMRKAGINAILPEIFNSRFAFYGSKHLPVKDEWLEKILPIAKAEGLEVHAWMWTDDLQYRRYY